MIKIGDGLVKKTKLEGARLKHRGMAERDLGRHRFCQRKR